MKVVLDSNVLVAAFAARGLCQAVLELCLNKQETFISEYILNEVQHALSKRVKLPKKVVLEIIEWLRDHFILETAEKLDLKKCRDPQDIEILGLALKTQSDFLITGDQDLLVLKRLQGIAIVSPREFWDHLRKC